MTASHCNDALLDEGQSVLVMEGHMDPQNLDMQWHRSTGRQIWSYFAWNLTNGIQQNRQVAGTGFPVIGGSICKYGQTTGHGCSTTLSGPGTVSYPNHPGPTYKIYSTTAYITSGGDSGGPWFVGNTAIGIHSGHAVFRGQSRSLYTAISAIQANSNIRVVTNCTSPC